MLSCGAFGGHICLNLSEFRSRSSWSWLQLKSEDIYKHVNINLFWYRTLDTSGIRNYIDHQKPQNHQAFRLGIQSIGLGAFPCKEESNYVIDIITKRLISWIMEGINIHVERPILPFRRMLNFIGLFPYLGFLFRKSSSICSNRFPHVAHVQYSRGSNSSNRNIHMQVSLTGNKHNKKTPWMEF